MHPDHRLKIGGVHLDQRFVAQDARVVDQHIHAAKGAHGRIDQGLRTLWRGDVVKIGQGFATGCGDLVHHDLCGGLVTALALDTATQIIDHHHRPALGQGQSMGSAQTTPGTGDDGHALVKSNAFCHRVYSFMGRHQPRYMASTSPLYLDAMLSRRIFMVAVTSPSSWSSSLVNK